MTAYSDLVGALDGYLATAAATMSNPSCDTTIHAGPPPNISKASIARRFIGVKDWDGKNLSETQEAWGFEITLYLPLGQRLMPRRDQSDAWLWALDYAIRDVLWRHVAGGGAFTGQGIEVEPTSISEETVEGTKCATAYTRFWAYMADVHSIVRA